MRWATWRVTTRLRSEMRLSHHPGSRVAGALGRALREAHCSRESSSLNEPLCPSNQPACGRWPLCVYGELIRTQTLTANQKRRDVPRPLIVSLLDGGRERYRAGESFTFDITLMGAAMARFPAVREVIGCMGQTGLGDDYDSGWGRFEVESVRPLSGARPAPVAMNCETAMPLQWNAVLERAAGLRGKLLRLHFVRPLRLLRSGTDQENPPPLLIEEFDFLPFWLALSRRLKDLAYFHGEGPAQLPFLQAGAIRTVGRNLRWWRAMRYSGTQECELDASGLLGTLDIEGDFEPLLPFLVAGEWLHAGKNTDLGDGRYELSPL